VIFNWHKLAPSLEEVYRLSGLLHIGELGIVVPRSGYTSLLRDSLGLRQDELKLGYAGGDPTRLFTKILTGSHMTALQFRLQDLPTAFACGNLYWCRYQSH
jgi:hypothetical protein